MSVMKKMGRPADTEKRAAIVAAASHSFFEHGFAATSIEGIASAAGVSKVTVYNHFGDKRGLFVAAVESECEKMRAMLLFDEGQGPLRDRLQRFGRAMVGFVFRDEMVRFEQRIAAETVTEPELGKAFLASGPHRIKAALGDLLKRATSRGEIQVEDTAQAAELLAAMFKGMADLERRFAGTVDWQAADARVDAAVDMFLRAHET